MRTFYYKYKSLSNLSLIILLLVICNLLSSHFFFRIDLSSDQIHSLSPHTKSLLLNLDEIISADVYLEGDFPAEIEKLKLKELELSERFNELSEIIPLAILTGKLEEVSEHLEIQEKNTLFRPLHLLPGVTHMHFHINRLGSQFRSITAFKMPSLYMTAGFNVSSKSRVFA